MNNDLEIAKFIAAINTLVEEHGIRITYENDFHAFKKTRAAIRQDPYFPAFDPDQSDLDNNNAIWLHGTFGGKTVQLQAMRLLNIENSLAEHFKEEIGDYALPDGEVDLEKSVVDQAPISQEIRGRVCYHGEFWLAPEYRGSGLTGIMPRMMLLLGHLAWRPDYIFGLQGMKHSYRGLGIKEGYVHTDMRGVCWQFHDGTFLNEALVWMTHKDLIYLLRHAPEEVFSEIESLKIPARKGKVAKLIHSR